MNSPYSNYQPSNIPFTSSDDDHVLTHQVVSYYNETLKNSPEILTYLQKIGIDKSDVVDYFKLGHCNRTLGNQLPEKNRKEGAALRGKLQRIGILKSNGHELFRGSIVVPIIDNSVVKQIYGQKICKHLRPGTPLHCYLPNTEQVFFNQKAIETCDEVIFCSSIIDALTFWCAGYKNVTHIYGLDNACDESILEILKISPVKRALIAFSANKKSGAIASTLAEQLNATGIDSYRIEFPNGMDANAYAIKNAPASQSLGNVIRKATWIGKGTALNLPQDDVLVESTQENIIKSDSSPDFHLDNKVDGSIDDEIKDEALPATVLPKSPEDIDVKINDDEIVINLEDRRYRVRGLEKNLCYDQLKVNLLVNKDHTMHVDVFDLYGARVRANFIKQAALELNEKEETIKSDLAKLLLKLEVLQEKNIHQTLTPKVIQPELSKKEQTEAMNLLQSPDLLKRIDNDLESCGVVGETTNKQVSYLATLSRKLDKPLAIMIQSTSAAGKSSLMDAVLSFIPEEERVQYSAMTSQSLFYMSDINLKHKVLAINEEKGASKVAHPLKLLQSDGQLTIASTGKDPESGRHVTKEYKVEGPVMIFSTTTAIDIDEELLNRCLVLTVNEEREQTQAIQNHQRFEETLEGLLATQTREDILRVHRNAQRLIKPLKVVNPFATQLTFLNDKTRTRRDHKKYLTLIRSITLLHQYQREIKTTYFSGKMLSYIEVTIEDIEIANKLANNILGCSLDDIPPQTQRLLTLIDNMVKEECQSLRIDRKMFQFTRRDVRAYCAWGDTQLKVHLKRLEDMEYLLIRRGGRGKQIVYELLYNSEGKDGELFLMGLLDIEILRQQNNDDEKQSVQNDNMSVPSRPHVGKVTVSHRRIQKMVSTSDSNVLATKDVLNNDNTVLPNNNHPATYRNPTPEILKGGKSL
jgi:hypothetical protein